MKGLIIYKSKYGATAQYAEWLGEELALPVHSIEKIDQQELQGAGYVIIGSSVYIGKLLVKKWLRKNLALLENKKIFVFVVGGSTASDSQQQKAVMKMNFPDSLLKKCEVFFLPGRLNTEKLSWMDRLKLRMGAMLEKDPVKKNVMRNGIDAVSRPMLNGLMNAVKAFAANHSTEPPVAEKLQRIIHNFN